LPIISQLLVNCGAMQIEFWDFRIVNKTYIIYSEITDTCHFW